MTPHVLARRDASRTAGEVKAFDNPLIEIGGALLGLAMAGLAILVGAVLIVCALALAIVRVPARLLARRLPIEHAETPAKARS